MAEALVSHILYLAPTKPLLKWGVPVEGLFINGSFWFLPGFFLQPVGMQYAAAVWVLSIPTHFGMRAHANKNPLFYRELRMSFATIMSVLGRTLYALPPRWQKGAGRYAGA